ncbi:DUF192 domain-containing protein [Candidatus Roizmanbacteria bacterium]|nr:DUF192 domain-containing protein [Candidatus Roizmanbacteria bacterium]
MRLSRLKKYFIFLLLVFVVFTGYGVIVRMTGTHKTENIISFNLEGKPLKLLVAKTPVEWEHGLMFVRDKKAADGMIFEFPTKEFRTFWNKNTLVNLDIYWLSGNMVVGKSELPSIGQTHEIVTVTSPQPVDRVVEVIR